DLCLEVVFELMWTHYNPKCEPAWSEAELRHKCREADTQPFDKPRGYLLREHAEPEGVEALPEGGDPGEDIESLPMEPPPPWPELAPEALHGLAGEIVQTLAPETESDLVAVLIQLLLSSGNAVGRGPHYQVEGDSHHANLFGCLVGRTGHGRKGTSRGRVRQVMSFADQAWCQHCVTS